MRHAARRLGSLHFALDRAARLWHTAPSHVGHERGRVRPTAFGGVPLRADARGMGEPMRPGDVGKWALALALGLGAAHEVRGQDPAPRKPRGLIAQIFGRNDKAPPAPDKKAPAAAPVAPSVRRAQALADLMRRQEVCQKMMEIGWASGDEELQRQAEELNQRAYDVYLQRTGQAAGTTADEGVLRQRLAADEAGVRERLTRPAAATTTRARATAREDER